MGIFGIAQDQVDLDDLKDRVAKLESAVASLQGQVATLTTGAGPYAATPGDADCGRRASAASAWMAEVRGAEGERQADRRDQALPRAHRPRPQGGQGRRRGDALSAVLLPIKVAQGVADGSVTLAFRRWRKQDVEPGQVFTTAAGWSGSTR